MIKISKSEVSRLAGLLDEQVQEFRTRPLTQGYWRLMLDGKIEKVRDGGRVIRKCVAVAYAVSDTGEAEIFRAENVNQARERLGHALEQLQGRLPKIAGLLQEAEDDLLAFYGHPEEHWAKLRSTNPLERFNREIGCRTDVVGIFADDASAIGLVSMLAIEANDEWLVGKVYMTMRSLVLAPRGEHQRPTDSEAVPELQAA